MLDWNNTVTDREWALRGTSATAIRSARVSCERRSSLRVVGDSLDRMIESDRCESVSVRSAVVWASDDESAPIAE